MSLIPPIENLSVRSREFRARAGRLLLIHSARDALIERDWDFLVSVTNQTGEYSEAQWDWLIDIEWKVVVRSQIDGVSVPTMINHCLRYRQDFALDDADFLDRLKAEGATELFNPDFHRLVGLYRQIEVLDLRDIA